MPTITRDGAVFLADFLPRVAEQERCRVVEIGIVTTHVHLLLRIHPMATLPKLIQRLKGGSSAIGRRDHQLKFRWEAGYNIESVSVGALPQVGAYVVNQHRRHPEQAIEGWP